MYGEIEDEEVTPFYWSAGLVLHPQFARDTKQYQNMKQMHHNKHLWPVAWIPTGMMSSLSNSLHILTRGQVYCDINLNIYKKSSYGLCLTSFEHFNPHFAGFQQLPWIANLCGIGACDHLLFSFSLIYCIRLGVWTQTGCNSKIAGFAITNTHNPCCQQRGSLLLVSYVAPHDLVASMSVIGNLLDYRATLFWPSTSVVDEYRVVNAVFGSETIKEYEGVAAVVPAEEHERVPSSSGSNGVSRSSAAKEQEVQRVRGDSEVSNEDTPEQVQEDVDATLPPPPPHSVAPPLQPMEVDDSADLDSDAAIAAALSDSNQVPHSSTSAAGPQKKKDSKNNRKPSWTSVFKDVSKFVGNVANAIVPHEGPSKGSRLHATSNEFYQHPKTWGVLRRNNCFIGVMCTKPTRMEKMNHKHATYQPTRTKGMCLCRFVSIFYLSCS